jgi:hypothetical protein
MPNKASQAEVITGAEQLIAATHVNKDQLSSLEKHRAPLVQTLAEIKALKTLQKTLTADKQKTSQDLQAAIDRLREQVIFLRTAIRGEMGPRTEKLVEYGIAPLRRKRRTKPAEVPEEPEPAGVVDPQEP